MAKSNTKSSLISESKISWTKIGLAVIAGLFIGYFILGSNIAGIDSKIIMDFVVLALLACTLALLLDIRRIVIATFGKC